MASGLSMISFPFTAAGCLEEETIGGVMGGGRGGGLNAGSWWGRADSSTQLSHYTKMMTKVQSEILQT